MSETVIVNKCETRTSMQWKYWLIVANWHSMLSWQYNKNVILILSSTANSSWSLSWMVLLCFSYVWTMLSSRTLHEVLICSSRAFLKSEDREKIYDVAVLLRTAAHVHQPFLLEKRQTERRYLAQLFDLSFYGAMKPAEVFGFQLIDLICW